MKKLIFAALLLAPVAHADCVDDVVNAQADIEAIVGTLDARQQVALTATLLELCDKREVGSSALNTNERRAFTTHGLNPERPHSTGNAVEQGVPVIIDADAPDYRDGHRERKAE
ncbi:MAG: hypothetical protein ACFHXK_09030 [bacterium]